MKFEINTQSALLVGSDMIQQTFSTSFFAILKGIKIFKSGIYSKFILLYSCHSMLIPYCLSFASASIYAICHYGDLLLCTNCAIKTHVILIGPTL